MIRAEDVDQVLYRIAQAALDYYSDKPTTEPGYTIDEDIDWCLQDSPIPDTPALRARIAEVITDPTTHRARFVLDLRAIAAR